MESPDQRVVRLQALLSHTVDNLARQTEASRQDRLEITRLKQQLGDSGGAPPPPGPGSGGNAQQVLAAAERDARLIHSRIITDARNQAAAELADVEKMREEVAALLGDVEARFREADAKTRRAERLLADGGAGSGRAGGVDDTEELREQVGALLELRQTLISDLRATIGAIENQLDETLQFGPPPAPTGTDGPGPAQPASHPQPVAPAPAGPPATSPERPEDPCELQVTGVPGIDGLIQVEAELHDLFPGRLFAKSFEDGTAAFEVGGTPPDQLVARLTDATRPKLSGFSRGPDERQISCRLITGPDATPQAGRSE